MINSQDALWSLGDCEVFRFGLARFVRVMVSLRAKFSKALI